MNEITILGSGAKHFLNSQYLKSLVEKQNFETWTVEQYEFPGCEIEVFFKHFNFQLKEYTDHTYKSFLEAKSINFFQSFSVDANKTWIETLLTLDLIERILSKEKAKYLKKINLKISYLGYSRQDKNNINASFGMRVLLRSLENYSHLISKIYCFDLHSTNNFCLINTNQDEDTLNTTQNTNFFLDMPNAKSCQVIYRDTFKYISNQNILDIKINLVNIEVNLLYKKSLLTNFITTNFPKKYQLLRASWSFDVQFIKIKKPLSFYCKKNVLKLGLDKLNNCSNLIQFKNIQPCFMSEYINKNFDPKFTCIILPDAGSKRRLGKILDSIKDFEIFCFNKVRINKLKMEIKSPIIQNNFDTYVILDDMIASGATIHNICLAIDKNTKHKGKFVLMCSHLLWFAIKTKNLAKLSSIITTNSISLSNNSFLNNSHIKNLIVTIDIFKDMYESR